MKTLQIQDGMVLICGPSTTGKSTLAKRIVNEAPYQDPVLVSHDEMIRKYLNEHGYPQEKFYTGLVGEEDYQFKVSVVKTVRDALKTRKFVIYESVYCNPENLTTLLTTMPVWGLNRPLTLIKMWPSFQLQMQFLNERPDHSRVDVNAIMSQRGGFKKVVAPQYFAKQAEWIKEYTVDDPRKVKLEFRKSGELTKELLSAYEVYEELLEKCPEAVQAIQEI